MTLLFTILSFLVPPTFTLTIEVTDNYSTIDKPASYCSKVPIVVNDSIILKSGDSIEVGLGTIKLTPVVNPERWVYGYEQTINITSDTTYIIILEVVD
tara:strand:- start:2374 stop:2667 length:294 start_codon:yes stop_codon:yes gene_type:complete